MDVKRHYQGHKMNETSKIVLTHDTRIATGIQNSFDFKVMSIYFSKENPFLTILMLPTWEDALWRTHSILSHPSLSTLTRLNPKQLKIVQSQEKLNNAINVSLL
jgi:hypothetical protein